MNQHIIENKYDLKVSEIKLLDKHFGTELHLISTQTGKYIVKVLPLYMENVKNEDELTEYLYNHGIQVARFLKSKNDTYVVKMSEYQFTVQQFIEGKSLSVNTAPDWFLCKSADFLGQTVLLLKDYKDLPLRFGRKFFSSKTVCRKIRQYQKELVRAKKAKDWDIVPAWENQIRYLKRISNFHIDTKRLTYANSHGDYLYDIPDSYKAIANLINNFLNWLYDNVEELSEQLIE